MRAGFNPNFKAASLIILCNACIFMKSDIEGAEREGLTVKEGALLGKRK